MPSHEWSSSNYEVSSQCRRRDDFRRYCGGCHNRSVCLMFERCAKTTSEPAYIGAGTIDLPLNTAAASQLVSLSSATPAWYSSGIATSSYWFGIAVMPGHRKATMQHLTTTKHRRSLRTDQPIRKRFQPIIRTTGLRDKGQSWAPLASSAGAGCADCPATASSVSGATSAAAPSPPPPPGSQR